MLGTGYIKNGYILREQVNESLASDIAGDLNGSIRDIFLYDTQTQTTTLVSRSTDGDGTNGGSYDASISADGRYIVYHSTATDIAGDLNGAIQDVFLYDTLTQTTTLVSRSTDSDGTNANSGGASISADGKYVVFWSSATDISGDLNGSIIDVFR